MDTRHTQPTCGRRSARRFLLALAALLAGACALFVVAWQWRVALATRCARQALDRYGLSDATFKLARLSPGCVVVENLRLGAAEELLVIDRAEVRFTTPDVTRGRVDQIRIRGVRTPAIIDGGTVRLPLYERVQALLAREAAHLAAAGEPAARPVVGEVSVYDLQVPVRLAGGAEVMTLRGDASVFSEPEARGHSGGERYRFALRAGDGAGAQARCDGALEPATGGVSLSGELKVGDVGLLLARARLVAPERLSPVTVAPEGFSVTVRGSLAASGWTNLGPFEVSAEVGRGSALAVKAPDAFVRFQTLRIDASGTPQDVQARLSVGLAALRVGGQIQAAQEEGRLVGMRGTARYRQTPTNRVARATLDSDLPGRAAAQMLSGVMPLLPRLMTEGGTLHAEVELAQASPQEGWTGEAWATAEARRSAVTLPAGRVGAGRVAITGRVPLHGLRPGVVRTELVLEEGYFFRPGLSVRGGGKLSLVAQPPYRSAAGTFSGQFSEAAALSKAGVEVVGGSVRFEGDAAVGGLATSPVWRVSLRLPEVGLAGRAGPMGWRTTAGASARVTSGAAQLALEGDVWLLNTAASAVVSNAVKRVDLGLERASAHVSLPGVALAALPDAVVQVALGASNGWMKAGDLIALDDARMQATLAWSKAKGAVFGGAPSLSWRRLDAAGLSVLAGSLALRGGTEALEGRLGGEVEGSALKLEANLRLPFADPRQCVIDVSVPEAELKPEDALVGQVRRVDGEVSLGGRVAAEAHVSFPGGQPQAQGCVRVSDVTVRRGELEVAGLRADVSFESGLTFRTVGRPFAAFASVRAGNIRLDKGRMEFQVTPNEVFMDRFEVGWCKGSLNAYSVHLDPKNPQADVVVYADRIDLGEALMMVVPFKGRMEGVLYGRFPVGIDKGRVKLSTGFLYSLPGQGGKLRLDDYAPMSELLARAGVVGDVQVPLAKALSDLDFRSVRMELEPKADGDAVFKIKLDGKSNYAEWPAPVDLNLNLHGPLEQLLNLGLDVSRK